jgi:hypothetical protein
MLRAGGPYLAPRPSAWHPRRDRSRCDGMILVFAGRRAQSIGGDIDAVGLRVRRLLAELHPRMIVGAMADGSDLMVLEAALAMDDPPCVHVVLPTPEEVFRSASVQADWRGRFDRVLTELRAGARGRVESLELDDGEAAYKAANVAFLDRAAQRAGDGERVMVLLVAAEGEGAIGQDLVDVAASRVIPAVRIDPRSP